MPDLAGIGELLRHLLGFWAFLFSSRFRARCLDACRDASFGMRVVHAIEATVATAIGLGLPAFVAWLLPAGDRSPTRRLRSHPRNFRIRSLTLLRIPQRRPH